MSLVLAFQRPFLSKEVAAMLQIPRLTTVFLIGLFATFVPAALVAQVCAGGLDYSRAPVQAGVSAALADGASTFDGSLGFGGAGSFGVITAGIVNFEDANVSAPLVAAEAGLSVPLNATKSAAICPVVGVGYVLGPNNLFGTGVDITQLDLSGGVSVGGEVALNETTSLIPSARLGLVFARLSFEDGRNSLTETETYGVMNFGVGLAVNQAFVIRPGVSIPIGLEGASSAFTVSASFALTRRQ